jgi:nitroreductase
MIVHLDNSANLLIALIHRRKTILPKRLIDPGPDDEQKLMILIAASSAPDHDQLLPWRFVEIPTASRSELGEVFEKSLIDRKPAASDHQRADARAKAFRSPWLLLAIARTGGDPSKIGVNERLISAGAAIQNVLLMATALGFGSALTSGKALQSQGFRKLFRIASDEQALCFINVGTIAEERETRKRPDISQYFSVLVNE